MNQSHQIAKILLDLKAVLFNVQKPFHFTSGLISPIYCDNRQLISYPEQRKTIIQALLALLEDHNIHADIIAGTATAGIPWAAWIADHLSKPMIYVRQQAKGHGRSNQIEGVLAAQQTAVVVEDLISTAGSSMKVVEAIREAQGRVTDCIALFSYEFPTTQARLDEHAIKLHTLTSFSALLEVAEANQYLTREEVAMVRTWQKNPEQWGRI